MQNQALFTELTQDLLDLDVDTTGQDMRLFAPSAARCCSSSSTCCCCRLCVSKG